MGGSRGGWGWGKKESCSSRLTFLQYPPAPAPTPPPSPAPCQPSRLAAARSVPGNKVRIETSVHSRFLELFQIIAFAPSLSLPLSPTPKNHFYLKVRPFPSLLKSSANWFLPGSKAGFDSANAGTQRPCLPSHLRGYIKVTSLRSCFFFCLSFFFPQR